MNGTTIWRYLLYSACGTIAACCAILGFAATNNVTRRFIVERSAVTIQGPDRLEAVQEIVLASLAQIGVPVEPPTRWKIDYYSQSVEFGVPKGQRIRYPGEDHE